MPGWSQAGAESTANAAVDEPGQGSGQRCILRGCVQALDVLELIFPGVRLRDSPPQVSLLGLHLRRSSLAIVSELLQHLIDTVQARVDILKATRGACIDTVQARVDIPQTSQIAIIVSCIL